MIFYIKAHGVKQVQTRFTRSSHALVHARPAMELVATEMMRIEEQTFASEGRRGGGSWRPDTAEWFFRKVTDNLDLRTGHATLALRRAMSVRGADHQLLELTDHTVNLGTDLEYADTQQEHRPFVKFTWRDRARLRDIFRDYVMAAWRAPV